MAEIKHPQLCSDQTCTGCSACYNSCPTNAISMMPGAEGFYRPVVDAGKCIGCLKCERSCPVITPILPLEQQHDDEVYAAWHTNRLIRKNSSSGGAFSALATAIIEQYQGVVYGAAYDDNMIIRHIAIDNLEDLPKLRLSKYAQSSISDTFCKIKKDLKANRFVLFCGTPCQAAGLRSFLGKEYDNLFVCDFICHGVPSPLMLSYYRNWLHSQGFPKILRINFRDKSKGWYDALRVIHCDEKEYTLKGENDNYWIGFNDNKNLQECCYNCKFLGKKRLTDITIADFWGIGKIEPFGHRGEIEKGVSAVILSTRKGEELFKHTKLLLHSYLRSIDELVVGNEAMIKPSPRPKCRDSFYPDLQKLPYKEFMKKYLEPTTKTKMVKAVREYLPAPVVKFIRTRGQK